MNAASIQTRVAEARDVLRTIRSEQPPSGGGVVVSGMLAEQLARELARGADPGAVTVGDGSSARGTGVAVHVIAGEPSEADRAVVDAADRAGVSAVLVQLWPQEDWTRPFVLSPFVVECRAGEGFPVGEIADRIREASDQASALASRIPVLRETVSESIVREAAVRAAALGLFGARGGASRPAITREQARMVSRLRPLAPLSAENDATPLLAGAAAAVFASGFAFRSAARALRRPFPAPVVNAAVAAAGTWALGKALLGLDARLDRTHEG